MLLKYNNLELSDWRTKMITEIRKKIESDWTIPTTFFVLSELNNQLKVSLIQPKENYSYDKLNEVIKTYAVNPDCIAILLITQTSLPHKTHHPTLFSLFKTHENHDEYIQKYQLYPNFKFFKEQQFKEINNR
jgi:hypothetical protein